MSHGDEQGGSEYAHFSHRFQNKISSSPHLSICISQTTQPLVRTISTDWQNDLLPFRESGMVQGGSMTVHHTYATENTAAIHCTGGLAGGTIDSFCAARIPDINLRFAERVPSPEKSIRCFILTSFIV